MIFIERGGRIETNGRGTSVTYDENGNIIRITSNGKDVTKF